MRKFEKQPNTLLRNNGDGTFTDVTVESGWLSFHPTQTATWADFNNDGWLDLFIGNETASSVYPHPSELYINNRDGTFSNLAREVGCEFTGFMKAVVSSDYNNDGWPDIFICGYRFQGSLANVAAAEALHRPLRNVSKMYLYRNNHDGTFTNVSKDMGLDEPVFAMGSNFGDIDNDGWPDMYLGTGNPDYRSLVPNRMFKNIDGKKFVDVTRSARVGNLQKGHGVAFADVDNDGDQDIFVETGGAFKGDAYFNSLYVNPGQADNNWIAVLLEGVQSNHSAIGARIAVTFTDGGKKRTVYMDVNSGGSFGASPLRKEIGIGKALVIDELIIKWPTTGNVQVFKNIAPCQFLRIREGSNQVEKMNLRKLTLNAREAAINMIDCAPANR